MTSLEYVENQIAKLKDDLQHYTMVEKDSALASQIRYDLEQFETIEKNLKALEIIKNHELADMLFGYLEVDKTPNDWNWGLPKKMQLTQEEWDLLKEVLEK